MSKRTMMLWLGAAVLAATGPAWARIKLSALPARERVEIQLDNGAFTLVEEERIVPLLKSTPAAGNNMIDFSWSNTAINKDSIQFRPIGIREGDKVRPIRKIKGAGGGEVEEVSVVNVAYPPNENALVWEVFASDGLAVKVRVSYLISNLTRTFSYRALAEKDESKLSLHNYLSLRNYSGEEYGQAGVWAGFGPKFLKAVGQQEEIKMLLETFETVPIQKTFTFDWYAHGPLNPDKPDCSRVLMHYKLLNDEKNNLGKFPLQPGKVRIFIQDGHGGEAFLGEDVAELTPLDGTMKLYLGESRDVVCKRTIESSVRHAIRGNLFDQELVVKYEIENFKDKPCTLGIVEQMNHLCQQFASDPHGDAEWERGAKTTEEISFDYEHGRALPTLDVKLDARPAEKDKPVVKKVVLFHLTLKNCW